MADGRQELGQRGAADAAPTIKTADSRRRLHPDERRAQIVSGAVSYFAEVGLDGNTRDLSKRLGITQSLIFNYFSTKAELIEAVYHTVYLGRLSPEWPKLIADRRRSLRDRTVTFYIEYGRAIFTYEWMRIFMFSGLSGATLNRRYLDHVRRLILHPLLEEVRAASDPGRAPEMEDLWALHGGVVYIGIRRFVYQMPCPDDDAPAITATVDRFLRSCGVPTLRAMD